MITAGARAVLAALFQSARTRYRIRDFPRGVVVYAGVQFQSARTRYRIRDSRSPRPSCSGSGFNPRGPDIGSAITDAPEVHRGRSVSIRADPISDPRSPYGGSQMRLWSFQSARTRYRIRDVFAPRGAVRLRIVSIRADPISDPRSRPALRSRLGLEFQSARTRYRIRDICRRYRRANSICFNPRGPDIGSAMERVGGGLLHPKSFNPRGPDIGSAIWLSTGLSGERSFNPRGPDIGSAIRAARGDSATTQVSIRADPISDPRCPKEAIGQVHPSCFNPRGPDIGSAITASTPATWGQNVSIRADPISDPRFLEHWENRASTSVSIRADPISDPRFG